MATQVLPSYLTATTAIVTINGITQTQVETVLVTSALPTQQLPPYLSASTFTTVIGSEQLTGVTTVGVPLTYIGPSIPLGPDDVWTNLGSTTPASITQQSSSTATPSTSSTATLQSSSVFNSASTITNPSSSITSNPSTIETSSAATSSSAIQSSTHKNHLSAGQLAGIIIAAAVVLIVIILLLILWCCRRRRRRSIYFQPDISDFVFIETGGEAREPGEGSPRPDGGEEDSFLRGSGEENDEMREISNTARLVSNPSPTGTETGTVSAPEGMVPFAYKTPPSSPPRPSGPKLPSPFFHASASSLFFNPSRGPDRSLAGKSNGAAAKRDSGSTQTSSSGSRHIIGNIIPTRQLMQMDDQWNRESNGSKFGGVGSRKGTTEMGERAAQVGSPLRPPPALGNETNPSRQASFLTSLRTTGSHPDSPETDDDERATLLTAHRFNLSQGGPGMLITPDGSNSNEASPSSWQSSLEALRSLSRFSWFQRLNSRAHRHSVGPMTTSSTSTQPLPSVTTRSSAAPPPTRPVSDLTSSSTGNTTFYDAPSGPSTLSTRSLRGRGIPQRPSSMPPLPPRALTTIAALGGNSAPQTPAPRLDNGSDAGSSFQNPALLILDSSASALGNSSTHRDIPPPLPEPPRIPPVQPMNDPIDILDTPVPAPAAVSPFSTASTRGGPAIPPGLDLANIRAWRESSSDMPSSATFGSRSDHGRASVDITVDDTLEDAPPLPRANWTQLRAVTIASTTESNRTRRTLGQLNTPHEADNIQSDVGSLHSNTDNLGPLSPVGSFGPNSRSPSRANNSSVNSHSGSSRLSHGPPSRNGHPTGTSGSSGSQLEHSNSVSSEGRRRPRREAGDYLAGSLSPTNLSPANSLQFRRARMSAVGGNQQPSNSQSRSPSNHQSPLDSTFVHGMGAGTGTLVGRVP